MGSWLGDLIAQGGYWGIAFLMFLETVFPPVPSEVIMTLAGLQVAKGQLTMPGVIASGVAGAMAGNIFWYLVGRAYGYDRFCAFAEKHGRWLTIHPTDVGKARSWFDHYGPAAVGIGRVVPTARSLISVPAGVLKMQPSSFLIFSTLGTATWTALLAFAGYGLGVSFEDIDRFVDPIGAVIIVLLVVLYFYRLATFKSSR